MTYRLGDPNVRDNHTSFFGFGDASTLTCAVLFETNSTCVGRTPVLPATEKNRTSMMTGCRVPVEAVRNRERLAPLAYSLENRGTVQLGAAGRSSFAYLSRGVVGCSVTIIRWKRLVEP